MPRSQKAAFLRQGEYPNKPNAKKAKLIDQYYAKSHCVVCNTLTDQVLCETCTSEPHKTIYTLTSRQTLSQSKLRKLLNVCQDCSNLSALDAITVCEADYADVPCDSLDCPVYYERLKAKKDVTATSSYDNLINEL
ncbi:DNA polymerase zeta [Rhizopus stolonifer]|uniref:DNA polymerase zeta n=1 Tax=Rhizopus stolonifer TaxID=4846 RepID=A0A367ILR4_RHIST|nr:DNA polymerase zeta [Rhizopus stolonifer]